jgi:NADPH-dependent glutamate synthase beta subunit-like oxidoreductase/glutamate synthase domain-containing protein 3/NAD-dependent dihydropyrimidine dehydrogenase PreA subunit
MKELQKIVISGMDEDVRVESRILEERIQEAVAKGYREIEIQAFGQHGLGGRLWQTGAEPVKVNIYGYPGQRVGSMGSPQTTIDVHGPSSDDVGWLNGGATIVVHGDATNGVGNAMAQGRIYIAGDIGARGMTITKCNPHYTPPELWVLGGVGDSFAEFMAGGIAVICGVESHYAGNILGHRPCVGMVGGKIFFHGPHKGFSQADAKLVNVPDDDWNWLTENMKTFLEAIDRQDLHPVLTGDRDGWKLLTALLPHERAGKKRMPMSRFRSEVWDKELGKGGLIGDLVDLDRSPIPVIVTGDLRRFVPLWENHKYTPPCQAGCPTGIPVQKRWELIRKGLVEEAIDMALEYTPFPATVCGYLCPNLCMEGCTKTRHYLAPVDVTVLGKASAGASDPKPAKKSGKRVAVIGGGPAGLSVAWQLWMDGHEPVVFDRAVTLGGKIASVIPNSRFPREIFDAEIKRIAGKITYKRIERDLTRRSFEDIRDGHDAVVVAIGAHTPRLLKIKGYEKAIPALEFLEMSKRDDITVGKRLVVIGAGNVGCDVATEGHRHGARDITLIDIQEPASFGKEREGAEKTGARFIWPVSAKAITAKGVELDDGRLLAADTVVFSIGDQPDSSFLPEDIATRNGYILVDEYFRSSDPKVYAIGDSVRPGLLTDAIGAGRKAARALDAALAGREDTYDQLPLIDTRTVKMEYYDPRANQGSELGQCSTECASCGGCRDCGICEAICPQLAISRRDLQRGEYEYVVDGSLCIGCGFCAGACPCGIWEIKENDPLE